MTKQVFTIDGDHFTNIEGFYDEIGMILIPGVSWGKNLDALADILSGGFGTPDEGFIVVWKHSTQSRQVFGYQATLDYLQKLWQRLSQGLSYDDIAARDYRFMKAANPELDEAYLLERVQQMQVGLRQIEQQIEDARQHKGSTIFDWIVAPFEENYPDIELRLE